MKSLLPPSGRGRLLPGALPPRRFTEIGTEIAGAPPLERTTTRSYAVARSGPAKIIPKSSTTAQRSWPNIVLKDFKHRRRDTRDTLCRDNHVTEVIILCETDRRSLSRIPEEAASNAHPSEAVVLPTVPNNDYLKPSRTRHTPRRKQQTQETSPTPHRQDTNTGNKSHATQAK
ncbi:hypothetical protein AVEN_200561-1 [Araneus ventricosus]|uniref:Uncharacterized protein n=1 Tax=Araneus ventricosus TaxID=182803 RepID=A0A4Y2IXW2_ARAVE|nr:hypothetical protein AVEN_200561-1 [Araneus ventricosus]